MAPVNRRVSASAARAHTRRSNSKNKSFIPSGLVRKLFLVSIVGFFAWAYKAIQPPPPTQCGSPNGPPVTAPRIKLRDGRFMAYVERGVPKDQAKYKIIYVHGFAGSRLEGFRASKELVEDLGAYIVTFDRPGHGESDPHPNRSVKSAALDIQDLADQLGLGSKFYVVSTSIGGHVAWGCIKYIPHRLAGAALLAPVVNYRWPSFPANLSKEAYSQQLTQDQWALRIPYYAPWLTYWWMSQKWFPASSVAQGTWKPENKYDREIFLQMINDGILFKRKQTAIQQGVFESLHRDMNVVFGKWEFDPMEIENPFTNDDVKVHIWQGDEDGLVPVSLQRYIAKKLPWISYHELAGVGHMLNLMKEVPDQILKSLVSEAENSGGSN